MRITKRHLRRIIKEAQSTFDGHPSPTDGRMYTSKKPTRGQLAELHNLIDRLITVMGPDEVAAELEGIAEEIRMGV
jgi:hypothetical protein